MLANDIYYGEIEMITTSSTFYWTAWVTVATLLMVGWTMLNVARARWKFKIDAPTMEGPVGFMSVLRVHANTVEQMVLFVPALWLCSGFYSDRMAAITGSVWIAGRIVYALGYYSAPSRRPAGFAIATLATLVLVGGTVAGLIGFV
jgi:glutathione S-transferase